MRTASKELDENSWKAKLESQMLEIMVKLDKLEKENEELKKQIVAKYNKVHDEVVRKLVKHKGVVKEKYSWIAERVLFWTEQDRLYEVAQNDSAGTAETETNGDRSSNQCVTNTVSARIGQTESAGQRNDAGAKAYHVSHPGVFCYNCGNKGHYKEECTRKGKMYFRCERYEGNVRADCPYSENQLERILQEN